MSVLDKLTEGIVNRDLQKEGAALLNKWEKTGLLEGLDSDQKKDGMARLLENQAKELLREASTMSAGDVEGFSAVAFPIVRRVFGNLIANDLVSVQPMSLPSGLIFFLDFTVGDGSGTAAGRLGYEVGDSLYGGGKVAKGIRDGVDLNDASLKGVAGPANSDKGPYNLNNGYSSPTSSGNWVIEHDEVIHGVVGSGTYEVDEVVNWDPDLSGSAIIAFSLKNKDATENLQADLLNLVAFSGSVPLINANTDSDGAAHTQEIGRQLRRHTKVHSGSSGDKYDGANTNLKIQVVYVATGSHATSPAKTKAAIATQLFTEWEVQYADGVDFLVDYPITDNFTTADALGSVKGATEWQLENQTEIPEIDIKVDSIAVTAKTKKLKAKWTPELGQDLNAYHNLDAEVELTSILSEQIALEIDREILEDLVNGATADTLFWSRRPGKFLNRENGRQISSANNESLLGADFTGTVSEWYETLAETINDVSASIHRKTLRGGANFVVCSPEVANILEFTAGFRASIGNDYANGSIGAVNVGSLSKKFDVYVDPYFPRNLILVGRKGGSFLESGYVYAPYVPLQVTPTIFGVEDFVPRKGVMTRYAKEMVRPDMYGLVICEDMLG
jgi:hypothetical protein